MGGDTGKEVKGGYETITRRVRGLVLVNNVREGGAHQAGVKKRKE